MIRYLAATLMVAALPAAAQRRAAIEEVSLADLSAQLAAGRVTAERVTRAYLARIAGMDRAGPRLRSVIATNPSALVEARASDTRRKAGRALGPLDGVPILVKDNIETRDQPTTAGSLALRDNATGRDAPVVARLRAAGAVILGKTNLSEWANIRSSNSTSGWSAVGGLVRNPYALDRSVCGSSSGSGAAVAASLAAAALGTETDGSIICPSAMTGLVGLKPTIGLVSRTHIVPISHSQDTAGPMARTVRDVALLFAAMVGEDSADSATKGANAARRDYAAGLSGEALRGRRLGVIRPQMTRDLAQRYDAALEQLKAAGAVLVEVEARKPDIGDAELTVLKAELKAGLNAYLSTTPATVRTRTLRDVITFNDTHAAQEMPFFPQDIFLATQAMPGLDDAAYRTARARSRDQATAALSAMLSAAGADILVSPSYDTPWLSDLVHGDQFVGASASRLPAVSGWPHLTVPMGLTRGLPVGLSFIGRAGSDALLLNAGYAFEQKARARVAPRYLPTVDAGPALEGERR